MTDGRHAVSEDLSLELHRAVAKRLLEDPAVVERARERVHEWLRDGSVARPYAEAWRDILAGPIEAIASFLVDTGERARQMRQTWQARLVPVPTPAGTGLCLEPHDLVISKYAAGRARDRERPTRPAERPLGGRLD